MAPEPHTLQDVTYIPLNGGNAGRKQTRFFYMIDALLRSRQAAGLETGSHRPDEDVNMYLTELLCRYAEHPRGKAEVEALIPYETELYESLRDAGQTRAKYLIYRLNADHLLITLGIFGNAYWRNPRQSAFHWAPSRAESIQRGKWYYGSAATYATRLQEGRRGLDELLDKLAVGFEDYVRILETLRGEYFHLLRSFSPGEWYHLCRDLGMDSD
jgi:hypothetical protein